MVCAHIALDENITVGALVPLDTGPSFLGYQERGRDVTKSM